MPKKKFEGEPYSAVNTVLLRDAAARGRTVPRGVREETAAETEVELEPQREEQRAPAAATPKVVEMPRVAPAPKRVVREEREEPTPSSSRKLSSGPTKKVRISPDEEKAVRRFLSRVYEETDSRVHLSQLARAGWQLALRLEKELLEELGKHPLPALPSTRDPVGYAAYEEQLIRLIHRACKRARVE